MTLEPIPTRRALLVWQRPLDETGRRDRCAVAELVQHQDHVSFRYFDTEQLAGAVDASFLGDPGLPIGADNLDRLACDLLMRRLPPRSRADFGELLQRFGLSQDHEYSDLSLLAYTGARLTSDSFSICETFDGFSAPFTYVFDMAGNRHDQELDTALEVSEELFFQRETENEFDPNAIVVSRHNGETVGYVNRLQAEVVGGWLDNGSISASVLRVNGRAQYPRIFVEAEIMTGASSAAA